MRGRAAGAAVSVVMAAALTVAAAAEDDLEVVRRAVAENRGSASSSPAPEAAPPRKGKPPQWLKVRVVDKTNRNARVSVDLPLGLVRAIGNDWPVDGACRSRRAEPGGKSCCVRIGEVLRTLQSGQGILEIDDEEASVRVWVE